jgi:hypothetical protein
MNEAYCKQSSVLTSIHNTHSLKQLYCTYYQTAKDKNGGSCNWQVSNYLDTIKGQQNKKFRNKNKSISETQWAFKKNNDKTLGCESFKKHHRSIYVVFCFVFLKKRKFSKILLI